MGWPDFDLKFMAPAVADPYADEIGNATQDRYVDEIAFAIAHMPAEVLWHNESFPELYTENARGVYAVGDAVKYAEVVDHGSYASGDYWSTVRYWGYTDGQRR